MENHKGYSCVRIPSVPIPPCTTAETMCKKVEDPCEPEKHEKYEKPEYDKHEKYEKPEYDKHEKYEKPEYDKHEKYEKPEYDKHEKCKKPEKPVTPNPVVPITASLATCTPLAVTQTGNNVYVTVSIPAEAIITLPKNALEIKKITKNLKITQCRFFNAPAPIAVGQPQDTPKLFLAGFVRKDIQYSEAVHQTATTVDGVIRDFVVDIPISCVVNLGTTLAVPPLQFDQQQVYEYLKTLPLPSGYSEKDQLMMGDLTEHNVITNKFLNLLPSCQLIYSQINEMDDAVDRVPLLGGPFEEGIFRTIQEKMVVIVQVRLTFQTV